MSSHTPLNLQQINSVCSNNPMKQMSTTFSDEKQFALTCVHELAQQTQLCACIHKHSVLYRLVCSVISPRGMMHVLPVFQAPRGKLETSTVPWVSWNKLGLWGQRY